MTPIFYVLQDRGNRLPAKLPCFPTSEKFLILIHSNPEVSLKRYSHSRQEIVQPSFDPTCALHGVQLHASNEAE